MNEGKGLLLKVINSKLESLENLTSEDIIVSDINLLDLSNRLKESIDNLSELTDEIIDKVIDDNNYSKKNTFRTNIIQLRDLLIGKRDYNLKLNLNKDHMDTYAIFIDLLDQSLENTVPGIVSKEDVEEKCNQLISQITRQEIINNLNFIESITTDYNPVKKDANLNKIMRFVNEHNLLILRTPKKNGPLLNINFMFKPKLDDRILEILNKLDIDYKELPNYLVSELKRSDVDSVYETYQMVKKNKAESYGILHLIKKSNTLAKLILILYGTPESIMDVVDSVKNKEGIIDIPLLKILLNYTLPVFLIKKNDYFEPKNNSYVENMKLLKKLGVNYKALITKTPLFMVLENDVLEYTLNQCEDYGVEKKKVINKLYKTLTFNPALIIENIELLKKYNVDIEEYLNGINYNLLKVKDLDKKINYLAKNKNLDIDNLDVEVLNKMIVGKVYRESTQEVKDIWSE